MQVQSPERKDPLEQEMAPTPVFLPGKFHGRRSLVGYSPWGFSRQGYWSGLPSLLQEIFPTQGSNPDLLHCRQIFYCLSHQGSPNITLYNGY